MSRPMYPHQGRHAGLKARSAALLAVITSLLMVVFVGSANAATPVPLGTAAGFSVLAGSTATNTGATTVAGDLGVSPGTAVTGFPPGILSGTLHSADAAAAQAKLDLTTAYTDAAGRAGTTVPVELGGNTFAPGVYNSAAALGLTGTVTLDGQGHSDEVFIFQAGSTLITASNSSVSLINGANPCNVFWQVGSSATLGTGTHLAGTIMALASITLTTGATVNGRALARNAAVTMDTNSITMPLCGAVPPPPTCVQALVAPAALEPARNVI